MNKFLSAIFTYLVTSLALFGCNNNSTVVRDNVLVYCSESSPQTFNPQLITSSSTFDSSSRQIYNRLLEFNPNSFNIKPSLATHWNISDNKKEYTFYLRKNVDFQTTPYFKPSRKFNADDVLFSFQRQWKKEHPYHNISKLGFYYFELMGLDKQFKDIIKLDEHKIKFVLHQPNTTFLSTLAMDFTSILSAEYSHQLIKDNNLEAIDNHPIGTGPFQLTHYQADAFIRYKAHSTYWKGKEKLKGLVFAITPDPSLRFARLIAGECDLMAKPLPIHIKAVAEYKKFQSLEKEASNISYLALNTSKKPFDNKKIRLAINHAINRQALLKIIYHDTAILANNPLPPNMWSFNKKTNAIPFSLIKARKLLKEAGYENGFKMDIWAITSQQSYNPNSIKMAELIQHDLEKININAKIILYEPGTFLKKVKEGSFSTALLGWNSDNGDPDNFLSSLLSCATIKQGTNASMWCNEDFDLLLEQAKEISSRKKRSLLYNKAQNLFSQSMPWVPIAHTKQSILINKRVNNFHLTTTDAVYFSGVSLEPINNTKPLIDEALK